MSLDFTYEANLTLSRLWPRLSAILLNPIEADLFQQRCQAHFPKLFQQLYVLYGQRYDFFYHLEQILVTATNAYATRSVDLKAHDQARLQNPTWFQSEQMVGAMGYADRLATDLTDLQAKIPYFTELGLTYLH